MVAAKESGADVGDLGRANRSPSRTALDVLLLLLAWALIRHGRRRVVHLLPLLALALEHRRRRGVLVDPCDRVRGLVPLDEIVVQLLTCRAPSLGLTERLH